MPILLVPAVLASEQPLRMFEDLKAGDLLWAALIVVMAWLLARYLSRLLDALAQRGAQLRFFVKGATPIVRIAIWFVAFFLVFDILSPNRDTFLAAMGSAAIAIGLGAQDLVRNLVGGLVIVADRPYQLGDRVKIGDAYGEIDHIGLRSTKLTTPEDTRVTIPNEQILSKQVFNANSGVPDCQVVTDIYLPHNTDHEEAVRIGREAAFCCPFLYLSKPVEVLLGDVLGRVPYLRLRIKAYVFDHRYEALMMSDMTVRAKRALIRQGML